MQSIFQAQPLASVSSKNKLSELGNIDFFGLFFSLIDWTNRGEPGKQLQISSINIENEQVGNLPHPLLN